MAIFNIRQGAFETNSSSVHALCINKKDLHVPSKFRFCYEGSYGWEFETANGSYELGGYFNIILEDYILGKAEGAFRNEYPDIVKKYEETSKIWYLHAAEGTYPEFDEYYNEYVKKYHSKVEEILAKYGCNTVEWEYENETDSNIWGTYVDHSCEAYQFIDDMLENEELLIHFLFGDSCVVMGNDNDYDHYPEAPESDYVFWKGN